MKRRSLLLKYEFIRVHTILLMTLGIQKQRNLWCRKEGGTAALRRGRGKIERKPNLPPPYFEAVSLVVFFCLYSYFSKGDIK
jgi:hypothetical protein